MSDVEQQLHARATAHGSCSHCTSHSYVVAEKPTRCWNCGEDGIIGPSYNIGEGEVVTVAPDGFTYCSHGCCAEDHEPRMSHAAERIKNGRQNDW